MIIFFLNLPFYGRKKKGKNASAEFRQDKEKADSKRRKTR